MPMKVGIVGMPNAGKSSLFTALTGVAAEAANYPFTTIEPNVAIVPVADERLDAVADTVRRLQGRAGHDRLPRHRRPGRRRPPRRGAGQPVPGQHPRDRRDRPRRPRPRATRASSTPRAGSTRSADIETIETELIYADLEQAERRLERVVPRRPGAAIATRSPRPQWLRARDRGAAGRPAGPHGAAARRRARRDGPAVAADRQAGAVRGQRRRGLRRGSGRRSPSHAAAAGRRGGRGLGPAGGRAGRARPTRTPAPCATTSAWPSPGLQTVVRGAFSLLDLIAFFTAGEDKPAQSWHLRRGLSVWHAAGLIHSDIQRGFVRAEVVLLGRAARRRRLRRRPRPRHAAARGPRLRGRRRRRDHRQVHALTATFGRGSAHRSRPRLRSSSDGASPAARPAGSCPAPGPPPPRRPGRSRGPRAGAHARRGAAWRSPEGAQLVGVLAQRGGDPRALLARRRRSTASSEPWRLQQRGGGLGADPGGAGQPVGRVAAQGDEIRAPARARFRSGGAPRRDRPPRSRWSAA